MVIGTWGWDNKSKLLITNGEIIFFMFELNKKNTSSIIKGEVNFF